MTFFEVIDLIAFYGVDVVVLAIITSALTQILKTALLKNAPNKVYTFLPFVIGVIVYTLYTMISRVSFSYPFLNFAAVFEQGIKTGAAATVVYVVYEQFVRGKTSYSLSENAVAAIVAGFVTDGNAASAAAEIAHAPDKAKEIIEKYRRDEVNDKDIAAICSLLESIFKRET